MEIRSVLGQGQEFLAEVSALFDDIASLTDIVVNCPVTKAVGGEGLTGVR